MSRRAAVACRRSLSSRWMAVRKIHSRNGIGRRSMKSVRRSDGIELRFLNHVRRIHSRPQRRLEPPRNGLMDLGAMTGKKLIKRVRVAPLDPQQ